MPAAAKPALKKYTGTIGNNATPVATPIALPIKAEKIYRFLF